jgi:photoactive yellow protein
MGKNFFEQVAPCTNVQEFAGRFFEGVEQRNLNCTFPYLFDFQMRPTRVWIRMYFSERTETAWIFVTRQENAAA